MGMAQLNVLEETSFYSGIIEYYFISHEKKLLFHHEHYLLALYDDRVFGQLAL